MKKYLLPSALILALGLSLATAQNITKSLQQSQSPNGAVGMDSANNVYFPAHVLSVGKTPALTSCGSGTPAIAGTDVDGVVTMGTSATGCVITFAKAYAAVPWCTVTWQATPLASQSYTTTASAITTVQTSTSSNLLNYHCGGAQ